VHCPCKKFLFLNPVQSVVVVIFSMASMTQRSEKTVMRLNAHTLAVLPPVAVGWHDSSIFNSAMLAWHVTGGVK
jgi:hypothetical protein